MWPEEAGRASGWAVTRKLVPTLNSACWASRDKTDVGPGDGKPTCLARIHSRGRWQGCEQDCEAGPGGAMRSAQGVEGAVTVAPKAPSWCVLGEGD